MKKLLTSISLLFVIVSQSYALRLQTMMQLATARPREAHTVNQFDIKGGMRGGGTFLWVNGLPPGLQTIFGLIQLSSTDNTGYWIRQEFSNSPIDIRSVYFGGNGVSLTMAQQGLTQPECNAMYGAGFDVNIDTYDQAAIIIFQKHCFAQKWYNFHVATPNFVLSRPVSFPQLPNATGTKTRFSYWGWNTQCTSVDTTNFSFFTDNYQSHSIMENYQTNRQFTFHGWNFIGKNTPSGAQDTCLNIYASTGTLVRECNFKNFQVGLSFRHCLEGNIEIVEINQCKNIGMYIGCGTAPGIPGSSGYEQSNMVCIKNVRSFSGGNYADVQIEGCSGVGIDHLVLEGPSGGQYGLIVKNDVIGYNHVKDFKADIFHIEKTYTGAAILVQAAGQATFQFTDLFCQYNNTMIDAEGTVYINVKNIPYNTGGMKYKHRGSAGGWPMWYFVNVEPVNTPLIVNTIKHAQSWNTTGGGVLPTFATEQLVNANGNFPYEQPNRFLTSANVFESKAKFKQ